MFLVFSAYIQLLSNHDDFCNQQTLQMYIVHVHVILVADQSLSLCAHPATLSDLQKFIVTQRVQTCISLLMHVTASTKKETS